eukprot:3590755-Rhodomonas_salina.1
MCTLEQHGTPILAIHRFQYYFKTDNLKKSTTNWQTNPSCRCYVFPPGPTLPAPDPLNPGPSVVIFGENQRTVFSDCGGLRFFLLSGRRRARVCGGPTTIFHRTNLLGRGPGH